MKIAVSCAGNDLGSKVDQRFGRAPQFIVYDLDLDSYQVAANKQNLQADQGAGIQSAKTVADTGARAVITGNMGPKAYQTLNAAQIQVYLVKGGTVEEALEAFREGRLSPASAANVEGHWI
ncbi:MAG: NifB/NifX family molybdenum-iron cluster-binding protein [Firmicutes bacterium]|nr:NifB/NifX family molybdenum-iron cluster-binding protein [Bacillota bacterium]